MLFSSLLFLFLFLPLVLAAYLAVPRSWKNGLLLLVSILFYAWGGVSYTIVLLSSILLNHGCAVMIQRNDGTPSKRWLKAGILLNVVVLIVFKYLDFIIRNINAAGGLFGAPLAIPEAGIHLPLGISFFTFQQMSMLWDVYRSTDRQPLRLTETALYVALFPQLVAGPIVRYHDIIDQIRKRAGSMILFRSGVHRFAIGLFRKVVLANGCASVADEVMGSGISDLTTGAAWLGIVAYSLQIYFDFSGYSDMAIGMGRMFGFNILENFNFPYIARSIQEFWRRWHISLSTWFRDYVYIPLGGNRGSGRRTYLNLSIVFLLTGLWHGATWSFVFWGLFHGLFLMIERLGLGRWLQRVPYPVAGAYTLLVVMVGWVFFRLEEFPDAMEYVGRMFGAGGTGNLSALMFLNRESVATLLLAATAATMLFKKMAEAADRWESGTGAVGKWVLEVLRIVMVVAALFYCAIQLNAGSYNPFIYFRF
ncbi:MAG: MBOAT family protein [Flavobacteriales bacterium]|nr:MBOAT family protein [Flavobacteriales bacterium]